jgi:DNA-binding protein HU-beta
MPKSKALEVIDALFGANGIIAGELKRGERVQISGFGSFELRTRAPRQSVHPRTGKPIRIEASRLPAFRAGTALKDLLNRR